MQPEPHPPQRLTDLEMVVLRAFRGVAQQQFPLLLTDEAILSVLARTAVDVLTTGSVSGRRRGVKEPRRYPDPGSSPERIRTLARWIEASYHSMPNGWVSADEMREHPGE